MIVENITDKINNEPEINLAHNLSLRRFEMSTELTRNPEIVAEYDDGINDQVYNEAQLPGFISELDRIASTARDFNVSTDHDGFEIDDNLNMRIGDSRFQITNHCHSQIASKVKIPKRYYDRMMVEAPELLRENIQHWFKNEPKETFVRTVDGRARAILSSSYRPLDNFDLISAVSPTLTNNKVMIKQAAITERRMYIKGVTERLTADIRVGDMVQAGIIISNSEVGSGSLKIEPLIWRLVCQNGLITSHAIRKYHLGSKFGNDDGITEFLKDETMKAIDSAFWMKVRDIVEGTFSRDIFEAEIDKLRDSADRKIEANPAKLIELTDQRIGSQFREHESKSILRSLMSHGDMTCWGLTNAMTEIAKESSSYDRQVELERLANRVINLTNAEWEVMMENANN